MTNGWKNRNKTGNSVRTESRRHSLASKGIKTGHYTNNFDPKLLKVKQKIGNYPTGVQYELLMKQKIDNQEIPDELKDYKINKIGNYPVLKKPKEFEKYPAMKSPSAIADVMNDLTKKDREYLAILYLDSKNKIIGIGVETIGTLNSALVSPSQIMRGALHYNANAFIMVHNHPSGDPTFSSEDKRVADNLEIIGKQMGIKFLDSIVVGKNGYRGRSES